MTADEVVASVMWHSTEADRLEQESAAAETFIRTWEETGAPAEGTTRNEAQRHGAMLKLAGEAQILQARLMQMVMVSMPQWNRQPTLKMADALRRFWPGGRPDPVRCQRNIA